jgi:protein TonB
VALIVVSILLPGVLPSPHTALAWDAGPQMVRLIDIPLPPPRPAIPKTPRAPIDPSANAVPLVVPNGIAPEPETPPIVTGPPGLVPGLANVDIGTMVATPPPPPPPAPPPATPVRLHSGIDAPRRITEAVPVYPALARSAGVHGVVIIEAVIDAQGQVVSTKVLRSIPLLDQAAVDAVRQWRYTPARLNGEPIPVVMTVTVNFTLGR